MSMHIARSEAETRRAFLSRGVSGIGLLALASMLLESTCGANEAQSKASESGRKAFFAPKAKAVIYLYMTGGPSQFETFDNKPELARWHGKEMPQSLVQGEELVGLQGKKLVAFAPQYPFQKCGESGQEMTTLFPELATIADDIAIIRSMHTEAINYGPAHTLMNTGTKLPGRPSMGSWITYGLGSESQNLPEFVVMVSDNGVQPLPTTNWHSGFLPSKFQGVPFQSRGEPVLYLNSPPGVDLRRQRNVVEDDFGFNAVKDPVHVNDFDATVLHLLGIDHQRLTYRFQGREFRLTDVAGRVV